MNRIEIGPKSPAFRGGDLRDEAEERFQAIIRLEEEARQIVQRLRQVNREIAPAAQEIAPAAQEIAPPSRRLCPGESSGATG